MNTHTIKDSLNIETINKLNALRTINSKTIRVLGLLFKNTINTVTHTDTYLARDIVYGKKFADKVVEIRMMSKQQLHTYAKKLRYVEGYKSDYFGKDSLKKQDWLNMKLHDYVMNRLVMSN